MQSRDYDVLRASYPNCLLCLEGLTEAQCDRASILMQQIGFNPSAPAPEGCLKLGGPAPPPPELPPSRVHQPPQQQKQQTTPAPAQDPPPLLAQKLKLRFKWQSFMLDYIDHLARQGIDFFKLADEAKPLTQGDCRKLGASTFTVLKLMLDIKATALKLNL